MPNKKAKEKKRKKYKLNKELSNLGRTAKQIKAIQRKKDNV
tara:strand:- start:1456 stop:1578 length:123 start_codon:yes stop_codon:yes gene_type:complete